VLASQNKETWVIALVTERSAEAAMVETVNPEEFVTQQQKKKVEDYEFVKVQLGGGLCRAHDTEPSRPQPPE